MAAPVPGGCARMRRVVLGVVLLLSVCVRASHAVTDSQDSEYHMTQPFNQLVLRSFCFLSLERLDLLILRRERTNVLYILR